MAINQKDNSALIFICVPTGEVRKDVCILFLCSKTLLAFAMGSDNLHYPKAKDGFLQNTSSGSSRCRSISQYAMVAGICNTAN